LKQIELSVQVRMQRGKNVAKKLLREGKIPAVVYGKEGESLPLTVDLRQLQKILNTPAGANAIFDLVFGADSVQDKITAMISDLQYDSLSRELLHVDFKEIELDEPVEAEVLLNLTGEAKGVKLGGIIQQQLRSLRVECLPKNLPQQIDVDLTDLEIGDSLKVGQLTTDGSFKILNDPEEIIVIIIPPTLEVKEEEAAPSADEEGGENKENKAEE